MRQCGDCEFAVLYPEPEDNKPVVPDRPNLGPVEVFWMDEQRHAHDAHSMAKMCLAQWVRAKEKHDSTIECRRHPQPIHRPRRHWCGEFKQRDYRKRQQVKGEGE